MEVPLSWLLEYVDIKDYNEKEFCAAMTEFGLPVESVKHIGEEISGVVVGKVTEISKHPDADKLLITKVDVGNRLLQIVTGAQNLYVGAVVPVATDGSTLVNGVKIKKGKLRGEVSEGMMCSVEELGFTRNDFPDAPEDGIYIFPVEQEIALGSDVKDALQIDQTVFDFDLTSNRADCYSVFGIAREVSARYNTEIHAPSCEVKETAAGKAADFISVEIKNPELCPRYIARIVKNVKIEPSPLWMRRKLTSCGIRPINNIVDITNYVMLELGHPMHAFDIDNIAERKIIIRNANNGEDFVTLDETARRLDSSMLVIADPQKAVAIGGIMGGENSKVTQEASAVLFEAANFFGANIRLTSKKLGLRTDASARYERGLDPNLSEMAVNRAVALVELLGCGEVVPGMVDAYPSPRKGTTIEYCPEKINKRLGTDITPEKMRDFLRRLHIPTKGNVAEIPTFRADMTVEADISEEVARVFGYGNIKTTVAAPQSNGGGRTPAQSFELELKRTVSALGYYEMMTYSFENPKVFDKLNVPPDNDMRNAIEISNPLNDDYKIMRTTTANAIISALATNQTTFRNESASLFEIAKTYTAEKLPLETQPKEEKWLTFGLYDKKADFYMIKGDVESILEHFGEKAEFLPENTLPFMHPGRTAKVVINKKEVGFVGEVHPAVLQNYGFSERAYIAILAFDVLLANVVASPKYKPAPRFPAVKRDIALLAKNSVLSAEIESAVIQKGGKILEEVSLFDVYKGAGVPEGEKSLAYSLVFRASDRTLTDAEVNAALEKILASVKEKTGAALRE